MLDVELRETHWTFRTLNRWVRIYCSTVDLSKRVNEPSRARVLAPTRRADNKASQLQMRQDSPAVGVRVSDALSLLWSSESPVLQREICRQEKGERQREIKMMRTLANWAGKKQAGLIFDPRGGLEQNLCTLRKIQKSMSSKILWRVRKNSLKTSTNYLFWKPSSGYLSYSRPSHWKLHRLLDLFYSNTPTLNRKRYSFEKKKRYSRNLNWLSKEQFMLHVIWQLSKWIELVDECEQNC